MVLGLFADVPRGSPRRYMPGNKQSPDISVYDCMSPCVQIQEYDGSCSHHIIYIYIYIFLFFYSKHRLYY